MTVHWIGIEGSGMNQRSEARRWKEPSFSKVKIVAKHESFHNPCAQVVPRSPYRIEDASIRAQLALLGMVFSVLDHQAASHPTPFQRQYPTVRPFMPWVSSPSFSSLDLPSFPPSPHYICLERSSCLPAHLAGMTWYGKQEFTTVASTG